MMQHHHHHGKPCGHEMRPMQAVQPLRSLPAMQPIICPPEYICHDRFVTQEVPYIHPIVNVNREHIIPVPRHYFTETTENVMAEPVMPGYGPGVGGMGPDFDGYGPGSGPGFGPSFGRRGRRPRF